MQGNRVDQAPGFYINESPEHTECKCVYKLIKTLYLIFDYPYKYYTFKLFEV